MSASAVDLQNSSKTPWHQAVAIVRRWIETGDRIDELMARMTPGRAGLERARIQHLVYGAVRHRLRLERLLRRRLAKETRSPVMAVLLTAGFELVEERQMPERDAGGQAKIVHHAVASSKRILAASECGLVNAVLRRIAEDVEGEDAPPLLAASHKLAEYFSHPEWLVRRWQAVYGAASTRKLLEWNQTPGVVHVRWRARDAAEPPAWLKPTPWAGFYLPEAGHWKEVEELLVSGRLYVQDPSTRLPIEALAAVEGESILDLCASPGGKTVALADAMKSGRIVAVDLPGPRLERLVQNLSRIDGVEALGVGADVLRDLPERLVELKLPATYAGVLIDVPCSNTGVMRHRVDVKERLEERDLAQHARQQLKLLEAAARHVAPGGRLVYSTCSIDREENETVVDAFLKKHGAQFALASGRVSLPWECGHDGGGTYRLNRIA